MKNISKILMFLFASLIFFTSCDEEISPSTSNLTLNVQGLENLGADYRYEGWLIVDGNPVSAGIFDVDDNGTPSQTSFELNTDDLDNASTYVLTIEPSPDNDPGPSDVHILAGDFSGNSASITVDHDAAIGDDFTASTGTYILATPTDGGDMTDELSGVWWLDPTAGPAAGLDLPELPAGWKYEGWAVINGTPVSTGTFTSVTGADDFNGFSGSADGPPFPGEDFLNNNPSGLTFPTDLTGGTVVISVEPSPDNSAAPFLLKPLVSNIAAAAVDHTPYSMDNNAVATNPTGTVSK